MQKQLTLGRRSTDEFMRLHRMFVEHLGYAVGLSWLAAATAAAHAPWLRNIRGLIDPASRAESTASFLFALPILLTLGWAVAVFCADAMRRSQVLKSASAEFALAGCAAFAVFCMAIDRAVTAFLLGA